jgi:hypothetical protein
MSEFTSEAQRAFDREAMKNGYRRTQSPTKTVYIKDMPDERRHLLELQPGQVLYGVLYKHGPSDAWPEGVERDFERHSPEDCHYRRAVPFSDSQEPEAVFARIESDLSARLSVSRNEDFREWKAAERAFRKWYHALLAEYGFRKLRTKSVAPLAGGLMMEAREQKSLYADVFTFQFDVRVPEYAWRQYGFTLASGRWAGELDWLLTPREDFEESMRAYLEWVVRPVLAGGATSLWRADGFFTLEPYAPGEPLGALAGAMKK